MKTKILLFFAAVFFLPGCHWTLIGGSAGAGIGYGLGRGPGAAIGAGVGLIGGAVADLLDRQPHERHVEGYRYGLSCYSPDEEMRQACLRGLARARAEQRREAVYENERFGYDLGRGYGSGPYRYR